MHLASNTPLLLVIQHLERPEYYQHPFFDAQASHEEQPTALPHAGVAFSPRQGEKARVDAIINHLDAFWFKTSPYVLFLHRVADGNE